MNQLSIVRILAAAYLLLFANTSFSQEKVLGKTEFSTQAHPRVFATQADKTALWNKIQQTAWAGKIYTDLKKDVDSNVNRHITDPQYIVSRMQMNWEEGKHYTDFYTNGNFIPRREGNAAYPTVKITYGRSAFNSTPAPPYEKIRPYGNGDLMKMVDGQWTLIPFAETGMGAEVTNQKIIEDAYKASIVYYFTGEKKYAKFAADILWTFIQGASYHNQVNPGQTGGSNGYLSYETLGDTRRFATLPLALDFIHDYFFNEYLDSPDFVNGRKDELWAPAHPQGKAWAKDRVHLMFEKFLDNKLTRGGGLIGNWNTNEHESGVLYALTMEDNASYADNKGREYYVSQFLNGPTTRGHGAYLDVIKANINPETGLWPESLPGYGQGSIVQLFRLGYYYFNSGIDILGKEPLLLKAAVSFPQQSFPNGYSTNQGDGNYLRMVNEHAELLLAYAEKTKSIALRDKATALINFSGGRSLTAPYFAPLFFFVASVPESKETMVLPRVSYSVIHSLIFERNLSPDIKNALQYNVYGFGKDMGHRQANGMAMELYGRGHVLGVDPGWGPDYWVDQHVRYNSKGAAHNTVMPNGVSGEVNKPQNLEIIHAEPEVKAGVDPVFRASADFQFTDTYDNYTTSTINADQRRVMGIVRTGDATGYYIDIFRSKTRGSVDNYHDYIYHNIGKSLALFDKAGKLLPLTNKELDSTSGTGYTYFQEDRSLSFDYDFYGVFDAGVDNVQMKAWMLGNVGRTIYSVTGPPAPRYYLPEFKTVRVPAFLVRQTGEAWQHPFVAIYEPFGNGITSSVKAIRRMTGLSVAKDVSAVAGMPAKADDFVGLVVEREQGREYIVNAIDSAKTYSQEGIVFQGTYGVVSQHGNAISKIYLGSGHILGMGQYVITAMGNTVSAELLSDGKPAGENTGLSYTASDAVTITFPFTKATAKLKAFYQTKDGVFPATATKLIGKNILSVTLPAATNAKILLR